MSAFTAFAVYLTTISAFYLQSLVTVSSKQVVETFNIPGQNAALYISKLYLFRFLFKFVGCLLECVLYSNAPKIFKKTYDDVLSSLANEIYHKKEGIVAAIQDSAKQIVKSEVAKEDSTVNELLTYIKVCCEDNSLDEYVKRIKEASGTSASELRTYEDAALKTVLAAIDKEKDEIGTKLAKHQPLTSYTLKTLGSAMAVSAFDVSEVRIAIKKGDNVLYDYNKIFGEILVGSSDKIENIMKQEPSKEPKEQKPKENLEEDKKKTFGNFAKLIKEELPKKIKLYSHGMNRKVETIKTAAEIAECILKNSKKFNSELEKGKGDILGHIDVQNIKRLKEIVVRDSEAIITKISEQATEGGFEESVSQIIVNGKKISEGILKIPSFKSAVDQYAPSYTMIVDVVECFIKSNATIILQNVMYQMDQLEFIERIKNEMKTTSKDFLKTLVKNRITDIIIKHSTQIAENKDNLEIKKRIKGIVTENVDDEECKKKIKTVKGEITRRDRVLTKAKTMADCIVKQQEISKLIGNASTIFAQEIPELKETIEKMIENAINDIIIENATGIAKNEQAGLIEDYVVFRIKDEIKGRLVDTKNLVRIMKTDYAIIQFRNIVSILELTGMLATRVMILWKIHKSTKLGYEAYIIMLIESLLLGMFQTSLLTLAPEYASTIRLSIELSNMLVLIVQTVLDKLFYKRDRRAIVIQVWAICILNFLAVIIWICWIYGESIGIKKKDSENKRKDSKTKLWSPYLMFFFASLLKEFLFPRIVPDALVTRDNSVIMNVLFPTFMIGGILLVVILESTGGDDSTNWGNCDRFWGFLGPPIVVCVVALVSIHTKGCMAVYIIENKAFAVYFCFAVLFCYSVMMTISYAGVAMYVVKTNDYFSGYIESHSILCDVFTFCISKLSEGYDRVRKDYGLGVNVIIADAMEQPKSVVFVRECLTSSWKDIVRDLKTNISDCLQQTDILI